MVLRSIFVLVHRLQYLVVKDNSALLDDGQMTHLICVHLKVLLSDCFEGVLAFPFFPPLFLFQHYSNYPLAQNNSPGFFSCIHADADTGAACICTECLPLRIWQNIREMPPENIFLYSRDCDSRECEYRRHMYSCKINSPRILSCMYWFCAGGYLYFWTLLLQSPQGKSPNIRKIMWLQNWLHPSRCVIWRSFDLRSNWPWSFREVPMEEFRMSAKWPCRGAMWIFWPDFWVEFWKVNFGRWISQRWIFQGASFPGKNRTKKFDPRIRVRNSGVQNSFSRIRAQIRVSEVQNPLCRDLSLIEWRRESWRVFRGRVVSLFPRFFCLKLRTLGAPSFCGRATLIQGGIAQPSWGFATMCLRETT